MTHKIAKMYANPGWKFNAGRNNKETNMKILYIHGLGSTKNGNTVQNLKKALPEHEIIAHDFPLGTDNWQFAESLYGAQSITFFEGMGHRVDERYMPRLMGNIKEKLNDITDIEVEK